MGAAVLKSPKDSCILWTVQCTPNLIHITKIDYKVPLKMATHFNLQKFEGASEFI